MLKELYILWRSVKDVHLGYRTGHRLHHENPAVGHVHDCVRPIIQQQLKLMKGSTSERSNNPKSAFSHTVGLCRVRCWRSELNTLLFEPFLSSLKLTTAVRVDSSDHMAWLLLKTLDEVEQMVRCLSFSHHRARVDVARIIFDSCQKVSMTINGRFFYLTFCIDVQIPQFAHARQCTGKLFWYLLLVHSRQSSCKCLDGSRLRRLSWDLTVRTGTVWSKRRYQSLAWSTLHDVLCPSFVCFSLLGFFCFLAQCMFTVLR